LKVTVLPVALLAFLFGLFYETPVMGIVVIMVFVYCDCLSLSLAIAFAII